MTVPIDVLPPQLRAAVQAGAELDDVAAELLEDPLGAIEIAARTPTETGWVDGLFGPAGYVLAASDGDGELMTGTVAALPLQIAALVGLGPRRVPDDPEAALGAFESIEDALADPDLPADVAAVLAAPDALRWSARASWVAAEGDDVERDVVAIDGGAAGLLLCTPLPASEEIALVPCSSTDVWRALCALLPYPSETL